MAFTTARATLLSPSCPEKQVLRKPGEWFGTLCKYKLYVVLEPSPLERVG